MKVLILSVSDKRHMSMVAPYEEYLNKCDIRYDIIRVSRYDDIKEVHKKEKACDIYEFPFNQSTSENKLKKIVPFWRFRRFAKKLIAKNKYDFIIIWNENTAVLFADVLLKLYRYKYCVNVRDIFEIPLLKKLFNLVIEKSYFSTSPTPAEIFGDKKYYITLYNRDTKIAEYVAKKKRLKDRNEKLRITFMGLYASAPKTFQHTVDVFANDERFELCFYGDGFDTELMDYVNMKHIYNVVTGGAFLYENTYQYLEEADIINSYYNNFDISPNLPYVAGVKQSYTPMLYLPAINDERTTWGSISKKYGFSYLVNDENINTLPDDLFEWYHAIDFEKFKEGCDKFNKIVEESREKLFALLDLKFTGNHTKGKISE